MNKLEKLSNIVNSIFITGFLLLSIIPAVSHASGLVICGSDTQEWSASQQVNNNGGTSGDLSNFNSVSCQISNVLPQINHIINYLISAVGLFFVFRIVWISARLVFFASTGGSNKEAIKDLESAVLGFAIVMIAFVLVNTIYAVFQININGASGFQFSPF